MTELHITQVISYASGWQILNMNYAVMQDLRAVLSRMTEDELKRTLSRQELSPNSYVVLWDQVLSSLGWTEQQIGSNRVGGLRVRIPNFKAGVSARFLPRDGVSGTTSFVNWVLVEVPRSHDRGLCELSVLCVFSDGESSAFSRDLWLHDVLTIEGCLAQLGDLMPLVSSAPFVVLGVSRTAQPLRVHEVHASPHVEPEVEDAIIKSIEFPPEYYQAGVSILSYFGEVLKQRHPTIRAKVKIEQDGLLVRMHIEPASGDKEVVERTLEEYGLVIAEQISPSVLFQNDFQVFALEQKLEITKTELRLTRQLFVTAEAGYNREVAGLRDEVAYLRSYIGQQLQQVDTAHRLIAQQSDSSERVLLAQISQASLLVQGMITQSASNKALVDALAVIDRKLLAGAGIEDEGTVKRAFSVIHREEPTFLPRLQATMVNIGYGVSGNYVFQWLQAFITAL